MIQNASDFISFAILLFIPLLFIFVFIKINLKARRHKIEKQDEKYFREW